MKSLSHHIDIKQDVPPTNEIQPAIHSASLATLTKFPTNLIDKQGKVNITDFLAFQENLVTPSLQKCFSPKRYQYFHVDGGANVHATNDKNDFIIYYPHQSTLDLAAGNKTTTFGFGVILVRVSPSLPPIPLAPVFYCPEAPHATLSPPALRLFN